MPRLDPCRPFGLYHTPLLPLQRPAPDKKRNAEFRQQQRTSRKEHYESYNSWKVGSTHARQLCTASSLFNPGGLMFDGGRRALCLERSGFSHHLPDCGTSGSGGSPFASLSATPLKPQTLHCKELSICAAVPYVVTVPSEPPSPCDPVALHRFEATAAEPPLTYFISFNPRNGCC